MNHGVEVGVVCAAGIQPVWPFGRLVNVIECDQAALAAAAPLIDALGGAEDLAAHVQAVRTRVPRESGQE